MPKGCSTCGTTSKTVTASATASFSPTAQGKRLTKSFTDISVQDSQSCGTLTVRDDDDDDGGDDGGIPLALLGMVGGTVAVGYMYSQNDGNGARFR